MDVCFSGRGLQFNYPGPTLIQKTDAMAMHSKRLQIVGIWPLLHSCLRKGRILIPMADITAIHSKRLHMEGYSHRCTLA